MSLRRVGEVIGKFVGDTGRRVIGDGADVQAEARFRKEAAEYAAQQGISNEEAQKILLTTYLDVLQHDAASGYPPPESRRIVHAGLKEQLSPEQLDQCHTVGEASRAGAPPPLGAATAQAMQRVQAYFQRRLKGNKFFDRQADVSATIASNAVFCAQTIEDAADTLHHELDGSPDTAADTIMIMSTHNLQEDVGRFLLAHEELLMHERRIDRQVALRQATAKFEQGAKDRLTDMYVKHPIEFFKAATRKRGDAADMVGGLASAMAVFFVKEVISSARLVIQVLPLVYYYLKSKKQ